jgi:hypothetical protein
MRQANHRSDVAALRDRQSSRFLPAGLIVAVGLISLAGYVFRAELSTAANVLMVVTSLVFTSWALVLSARRSGETMNRQIAERRQQSIKK